MSANLYFVFMVLYISDDFCMFFAAALCLCVSVQSVRQQTLVFSAAAPVGPARAELIRGGAGGASVFCLFRWQSLQVVYPQKWP